VQAAARPPQASPDHFVELYASDSDFPARKIAQHLARGLEIGEAAVLFASAEHMRSIRLALDDELPSSPG
jgi:hypothetical protein